MLLGSRTELFFQASQLKSEYSRRQAPNAEHQNCEASMERKTLQQLVFLPLLPPPLSLCQRFQIFHLSSAFTACPSRSTPRSSLAPSSFLPVLGAYQLRAAPHRAGSINPSPHGESGLGAGCMALASAPRGPAHQEPTGWQVLLLKSHHQQRPSRATPSGPGAGLWGRNRGKAPIPFIMIAEPERAQEAEAFSLLKRRRDTACTNLSRISFA